MQNLSRQNLIALWQMARPLLLLVVTPIYLIGSLIARVFGYQWDTPRFWWGLLALLPVILAAHYANEYVDFETDALTKRTPFSGGSGILAHGLGSRRMALGAIWVMPAVGLLIAGTGFSNEELGGTAVLLWALGTFVGLAYSLPPFKLAWRGWSEAINALVIGLLLPLYGYAVQTERMDWQIIVGTRSPLPTVLAMLLLLPLQMGAWILAGG